MEKRVMRNMTSGSSMKLVLGPLIPMLFGSLFQQFYNMTDTIIMGKYLGVSALVSVGSTDSVNFMIIGSCMGVRGGFTAPVTRKFGEKNESAMRRFVANSSWPAAASVAAMTVVVCIFCRQVLMWMRTSEDITDGAYSYVFVIFMGIPIICLYNLLSSIIRSLRDSITPVIFLLISSVMNIILDLFTIIMLKVGVAGVAWVIVISRAVSGILCLPYMKRKFTTPKIQGGEWKPDAYAMRTLCGIGIPMGLQYSITAIGSMISQAAVNSFGSVTIASVTTGSKVSMFFYRPFDTMGATIATCDSQNVGAKKLDHVHQSMKSCITLGAAYSVLVLMVPYFFSDVVVLLPVDVREFEILKNIRQFLMTNVAFYSPLAPVSIARFMIQGSDYSKFVTIAGACEMDAHYAVVFLISWLSYNTICFANPLVWTTADIFLTPAYLYVIKRLRRRSRQIEIHLVTGASVVAAETGCRRALKQTLKYF